MANKDTNKKEKKKDLKRTKLPLGKHEIRLIILYMVMLVIGIYLSIDKKKSICNAHDLVNLFNTNDVINLVMFIIIAVVLFNVIRNEFLPLNKIIESLRRISNQIENEKVDNNSKYIWDKYKSNENLFQNDILDKIWRKYKAERKSLDYMYGDGYRCDIEDYINENFIDNCVKKSVLSIIPGVMTGLGILGTFIGLTLGLQNFSTGNASEINASIAPLMEGIKVAFHTSIYGMVFSLTFNYIFKKKLYEAYIVVDDFIDIFNKRMIPDYENERILKILNYQKEQIEETKKISSNISNEISKNFNYIMKPYFEKLDETLIKVAEIAKESHKEGLEQLIDNFMKGMNEAMGNSFTELGKTIQNTCEFQEKSVALLKDLLNQLKQTTTNVIKINKASERTIEVMSEFMESVNLLQSSVNDSFNSLKVEVDKYREIGEHQEVYIKELIEYEKNISEFSSKVTKDMVGQLEMLKSIENEISESTRNNIEQIARKAEEVSISIAESAKKQIQNMIKISSNSSSEMNEASKKLAEVINNFDCKLVDSLDRTFKLFDTNLADITSHLSGTLQEVKNTTEKVPKVVLASYDGMEMSFKEMQHNIDALTKNIATINKKTQLVNEGNYYKNKGNEKYNNNNKNKNKQNNEVNNEKK